MKTHTHSYTGQVFSSFCFCSREGPHAVAQQQLVRRKTKEQLRPAGIAITSAAGLSFSLSHTYTHTVIHTNIQHLYFLSCSACSNLILPLFFHCQIMIQHLDWFLDLKKGEKMGWCDSAVLRMKWLKPSQRYRRWLVSHSRCTPKSFDKVSTLTHAVKWLACGG